MKYMNTKQAEKKWNISERRIRQLLSEGRIDDTFKVGNSWNIPEDSLKPVDKRYTKTNDSFIFNLDSNYFDEVDRLKNC